LAHKFPPPPKRAFTIAMLYDCHAFTGIGNLLPWPGCLSVWPLTTTKCAPREGFRGRHEITAAIIALQGNSVHDRGMWWDRWLYCEIIHYIYTHTHTHTHRVNLMMCVCAYCILHTAYNTGRDNRCLINLFPEEVVQQ
jgi:hypothetical protein